MFSKSNKRISLNPLDNRQYEADTTPIITDYQPPTPTASAAPSTHRSANGYSNGQQGHRGNGGYSSHGQSAANDGRALKSAPIHLPAGYGGSSSASGSSSRGGPRYPHQGDRRDGQGNAAPAARRNNTYHSSSAHHGQQSGTRPQQQRHNTHHGKSSRYQHQQPQAQQQMTYHSSRSQPDLHSGYQAAQQMYSPTSPSFHHYPPSPSSPLPPYVERPLPSPTMAPPPPSYSPSGGRSHVSNDPEIAMYESSGYYTNRNRKQQQQRQMAEQRRRQQQQQDEKDECCSCFKEIGEFCPCLCFCCVLGGMAA
ncbi:unnamed protein product [Mortierella alpina]